jgi:hypothetical protein
MWQKKPSMEPFASRRACGVWIETICRLGRYLLRTVARRRVRGLALVDLSTICLQNLASLDTVTQIKIHENFSIDFENFMGIAIETLVPLRYV